MSLYQNQLRALGVAPGEKLEVSVGDTVRVTATIKYRGPALSDYFYAAIGNKTLGIFDEIIHAQKAVSFYASTTWMVYTMTVDIPITSDISVGTKYDLYCKIKGHTEAGLPEVDDCIDVVSAVEFKDFAITDYSKV